MNVLGRHYLEIALQNMNELVDRISWLATLVIDQEAFDSIIAAIEDPAKESRAFVWAADPNMDPNDVDEEQPEEYRYTGHYKVPLKSLKGFYREVSNPDWQRMYNGWSLALDTPWPDWRRRDLS